jgi:hypothetical protein
MHLTVRFFYPGLAYARVDRLARVKGATTHQVRLAHLWNRTDHELTTQGELWLFNIRRSGQIYPDTGVPLENVGSNVSGSAWYLENVDRSEFPCIINGQKGKHHEEPTRLAAGNLDRFRRARVRLHARVRIGRMRPGRPSRAQRALRLWRTKSRLV